jgi:hypothetical protein
MQGKLDFGQLMNIVNSDSLKQMESMYTIYDQKVREIAGQAAVNAEEAKANAAKSIIEFENQFTTPIEQAKLKLEEMRLNLEGRKIDIMETESRVQAELSATKLKLDEALKRMDLTAEASIEENYLNEQRRSNMVNEGIQLKELEINTMLETANIANDDEKHKINLLSNEKVAKLKSKEKIKD